MLGFRKGQCWGLAMIAVMNAFLISMFVGAWKDVCERRDE